MRQKARTLTEVYAHYDARLAGQDRPIHEGEPQCGWYLARMAAGREYSIVAIWLDREVGSDGYLVTDEEMRAAVDGVAYSGDIEELWLRCAKRPISVDAYKRRLHELRQGAST